MVPRDFLDEIHFAQHVHSPRRHGHDPASRGGFQREPECGENPLHVNVWNRRTEQTADALSPERDERWVRSEWVGVHDGAPGATRARGVEQGAGSGQGHRSQIRVRAALEPHARFGLETHPTARTANRQRVEAGAFEHDGGGRVDNLGVCAAHDTGHGDGAGRVGNDERCWPECSVLAVKRAQRFARSGGTHANLRTLERAKVEGVHRVAELEQYVVRDVHDVADGAHVDRPQSGLHPVRRRRHPHCRDGTHVPDAEVRVLDDDLDVALSHARQLGQVECASWRRPAGCRRARLSERQSKGGRDLSCHAGHRHAVGSIGGDLEIDHCVVIDRRRHADLHGARAWYGRDTLDALDGESAHGHGSGDLVRRARNVDEVAQPREGNLHSGGNCSRKRRSFS